ncbi:unnamed protein product [Arctogadus glacialis]
MEVTEMLRQTFLNLPQNRGMRKQWKQSDETRQEDIEGEESETCEGCAGVCERTWLRGGIWWRSDTRTEFGFVTRSARDRETPSAQGHKAIIFSHKKKHKHFSKFLLFYLKML